MRKRPSWETKVIVPKRRADMLATRIPTRNTEKRPNLRKLKTSSNLHLLTKIGTRKEVKKSPGYMVPNTG